MQHKAHHTISTVEDAILLGLTKEEFHAIQNLIGRIPNFTELAIFSAMWSEHCSYKNSIKRLKTLPKKGKYVLAEAGEENAGLIDIGGGLACAFKIESHNHPSAIEPYQGAATGVGGINRDIFTMGARPIAQMNSLRFGDLAEKRTKWLLENVVKGIGNYGNSFGIPTVGGEVFFDTSYHSNPLVNAMSIGIVEKGKTISATSYGAGNLVYIVGARTGKDGINGAAFASKDLTESKMDDLPAIQVGDPFQEKLLLEATMELAKTDAIIGMQDMGAAGIICSSSEMSATKGYGMQIHLDKVPTRQANMQPFEILLSESQERMLVIIKKGHECIVEDIFEKWDITAKHIGTVTEGGQLEYFMNGEKIVSLPAKSLVLGGDAPQYEREFREPKYYKAYKTFDIQSISDIQPEDIGNVLTYMVQLPNIASKRWVYEQYDSMVGTCNKTTNTISDASVIYLKGTSKSLVATVDCNALYVHADPNIGTQIAVAEAARNIVCTGGKPMAITNCLNFGNPYNPEAYWQFYNAIEGMKTACLAFDTSVTGGNVSFYNQTVENGIEEPILPTPTIGMVGILENKNQTGLSFNADGDRVYLIGKNPEDIASSQYLIHYKKHKVSPVPYFNLNEEITMQNSLSKIIQNGYISSAHDCSEGGVLITVLECAMAGNMGVSLNMKQTGRLDALLFGEAQSRVIISCNPKHAQNIEHILSTNGVPYTNIGHVSAKTDIVYNDMRLGSIKEYTKLYNSAIEKQMQ